MPRHAEDNTKLAFLLEHHSISNHISILWSLRCKSIDREPSKVPVKLYLRTKKGDKKIRIIDKNMSKMLTCNAWVLNNLLKYDFEECTHNWSIIRDCKWTKNSWNKKLKIPILKIQKSHLLSSSLTSTPKYR